jgi:hypothetical protein
MVMHRTPIEPGVASDISTISPKIGSLSNTGPTGLLKDNAGRLISKANNKLDQLQSIVNDLVKRVANLESKDDTDQQEKNDFKRNRVLFGGTDGEPTQSSNFTYEQQLLGIPKLRVTAVGRNKEVRTDASGEFEGYVDLDERAVCIVPFTSEDSVEVGDGTVAFTIPYFMDKYRLYDVIASVHTLGVTGQTSIQIRKRHSGSDVDMLITNATIGNEYYAADEAVDASNNYIETGDQIYIDIDEIHSGTAPVGLSVTMIFRRQ